MVSYNGEVLAFRDTGEMLPGALQLSRLPVRKDWFVGLAPDHVDHSHPDVGDAAHGAAGVRRRLLQVQGEAGATVETHGTLSHEAEASFHQLFEEVWCFVGGAI